MFVLFLSALMKGVFHLSEMSHPNGSMNDCVQNIGISTALF